MTVIHKSIVALATILAVSGCATQRYCIADLPYQKAETIPELQGTDGLQVPSSQTALTIPSAPAEYQPYGRIVTDEDGDKYASCLDHPERLPVLEDAPDDEGDVSEDAAEA